MNEPAERPEANRHALLFVFITVFVDMTGFGIIMPALPQFIMELTGEDLAQAARYGGWLMFLYAVLQFIAAPVIGNLSDRFGRRPILLLSLAGYAVNYVLMALAPTLLWLFIGRAFSGVFGATMTTANAFIADVSPPEKKAQNFGLIGAAFGLGFILGPVIGGVLGEFGPRVPFYAAAGLALANLIYGLIVLPETLALKNRRAFRWKRANPLGSFASMRTFPIVIGLGALLFLYNIAHTVYPSTWAFFTIEKFGWSEAQVGFSLGIVGLTAAVVQGGLTRVIIPKIGPANAVYLGAGVMTLSLAGYAAVTEGWMVYPLILIGGLAGLVQPSIQSILSNNVPPDQQGELQGALMSLMAITMIIGPVLMTQLLAAFTEAGAPIYLPGAPYIAAAVLTALSLIPFTIAIGRAEKRKAA